MISKERERARLDLRDAENEAQELAKHADTEYVPFLKDMNDVWKEERRTGEKPKILVSAPGNVIAVYARYRDARNRLISER